MIKNSLGKTYDQSMITPAVPPGLIQPFGGGNIPFGWLLCDGTPISRTTYALLFSAIGTAWGDGSKNADGTSSGFSGTHFNLPDLRGRFLRGKDGGIARDPDRTSRTAANTGGNSGDNVGSVQGDAFQGHKHIAEAWSGLSNLANAGAAGLVAYSINSPTVTGSANQTDTGYGTPRNAAETRPLNANINYIIKI